MRCGCRRRISNRRDVRGGKMKGYIYITGKGADPAVSESWNDPLFSATPTLGACMPNIRRLVTKGDHIFVVSGKTPGVQQYVVGGFRVEEKISALAAFERLPQNRLSRTADGIIRGNIIVQADGTQHPLDTHKQDSFESRIENYIVGSMPVSLTTPREVEKGRAQTLGKLAAVLQRPRGNRVIDVMSRWTKLDEEQIKQLLDWLNGIKSAAA